ncbi:hypothetical protein K439DRAFT_1630959 [Ramaria rubella]|nr:hypothetical protein K439DRAFT_1630959 [Ramaria rubella]
MPVPSRGTTSKYNIFKTLSPRHIPLFMTYVKESSPRPVNSALLGLPYDHFYFKCTREIRVHQCMIRTYASSPKALGLP